MRFLKEHSYDIVRLYINQIGITIFSLLLYTSVGSLDDKSLSLKLQIIVSVFAMLFFFALLYTMAWDWGANDIIRIEAGRQEKHSFKAALIALLANVINFVLAAVCIISMLLYIKGVNGAISVAQIFNVILRLTNAMYLGVIKAVTLSIAGNENIYNLVQSILYFAAPMLPIIVTHIGYLLGLKNFKIFRTKKKSAKK